MDKIIWVKVYRKGEGFETLRLETRQEAFNLWAALDTYLTTTPSEVMVENVTVYNDS